MIYQKLSNPSVSATICSQLLINRLCEWMPGAPVERPHVQEFEKQIAKEFAPNSCHRNSNRLYPEATSAIEVVTKYDRFERLFSW